jgi:tetratricopeptide (TPR) repeat protein
VAGADFLARLQHHGSFGTLQFMNDLVKAAMAAHQAGQLGQAAQLYQKELAREPGNAEAMHLLGVLYHQQGDNARAIELMGRAVVSRPNNAVFHANLAEAYRAVGQHERAAGCCRAAISLRPNYSEAIANLGLALQGMGQREAAVEQYQNALRLRPDFATALNNLGNVERELGRLDLALEHFRHAVRLDPAHAPAQSNLGQLLLDRGLPLEALPYCQEAVRLQPSVASLHHNLGNVFRELERYAEARAAYLEATRLAPGLAKAHAHLGLTLMREGQQSEALVHLKGARELDPTDFSIAEFLGDLYVECEQFAEAAPHYQRAIALAPDERWSLHLSLGWALQEDGRLDEAGEHYQIAHRLAPDVAMVFSYLGGFHEEKGDLLEAESAYRRAMRLQPGFSLPFARLATLLRGKLPDADFAAVEAHLARPDQLREPRGRLLFGLAHVLDARGQYARAAHALDDANSLILESRRGRRDYSPTIHQQFVDNVISEFDSRFFARTAGIGNATRRPIFIFGLPRSGTTLIEQILASHGAVHGGGELRLGRQAFEAIPAAVGRAEAILPMPCVKHLDTAAIRRLARQYLDRLSVLAGGEAARVTDKMPDNYMYVGLLAALFPRATFIHCRRDLRDVAVSCWMTDFRSMLWANDKATIASRFHQYQRLMDHWQIVSPVAIHDAGYEETVNDLESVARRLVAACGLEWDPSCLSPHLTRRKVRTASLVQVRQPVYRDSLGRWKHYETELADLFGTLPAT